MTPQDPLSQLRDIHLPAPIHSWPPAPGWWMLGVLVVGLTIGLILWRWIRHRRLAYKREALAQYQSLHARYLEHNDNARLLAEVSVLLKRTCITRYGREQTAGLAGEQWLVYLDQTGKCTEFSQGPGRVLVTQRFLPKPTLDGPELLRVTLMWLNKQC